MKRLLPPRQVRWAADDLAEEVLPWTLNEFVSQPRTGKEHRLRDSALTLDGDGVSVGVQFRPAFSAGQHQSKRDVPGRIQSQCQRQNTTEILAGQQSGDDAAPALRPRDWLPGRLWAVDVEQRQDQAG